MTEPAAPGVIKVLIIDDHRVFADGLARVMSDEPDIEVIGVASSGHQGIAMAATLSPTVVLVDYHLPDHDGLAITARIKAHAAETYVVMLTGSAEDSVLLSAIEAGCSGYLTKTSTAVEVAQAVRLAAAGEATISPRELARLLPQLGRNQQSIGSDLTPRELQILGLLAPGTANSAIATDLHLSINTVRNYVQSILTKLGAHSKLEAVAVGVQQGLIRYPNKPPG